MESNPGADSLLSLIYRLQSQIKSLDDGIHCHSLSTFPSELASLSASTLLLKSSTLLSNLSAQLSHPAPSTTTTTHFTKNVASLRDFCQAQRNLALLHAHSHSQAWQKPDTLRYKLSKHDLCQSLSTIAAQCGFDVFSEPAMNGSTSTSAHPSTLTQLTLGGKTSVIDIEIDTDNEAKSVHFTWTMPDQTQTSEATTSQADTTNQADHDKQKDMDALLMFLLRPELDDLRPFAKALKEIARIDRLAHSSGIDLFSHAFALASNAKSKATETAAAAPDGASEDNLERLRAHASCPLHFGVMPFTSTVLFVPPALLLSASVSSLRELCVQHATRVQLANVKVTVRGKQVSHVLELDPPMPLRSRTALEAFSIIHKCAVPAQGETETNRLPSSGFFMEDFLVRFFQVWPPKQPAKIENVVAMWLQTSASLDRVEKYDAHATFTHQHDTTRIIFSLADAEQESGILVSEVPLPSLDGLDALLELLAEECFVNHVFKSAFDSATAQVGTTADATTDPFALTPSSPASSASTDDTNDIHVEVGWNQDSDLAAVLPLAVPAPKSGPGLEPETSPGENGNAGAGAFVHVIQACTLTIKKGLQIEWLVDGTRDDEERHRKLQSVINLTGSLPVAVTIAAMQL